MASSCGKYPTLALTSFPCFTVSKPQMRIVPADGVNTVTNAFISVVFPAPLRPTTARFSPGCKVRFIFFKVSVSAPG